MHELATRFSHPFYNRQALQLCSPYSGEFYPRYASREIVHTTGLYHVGVQVYLFRRTTHGGLDVLVTQRSEHVDISRNCYDQIAIQMTEEDQQSLSRTVQRGLQEELGLLPSSYTWQHAREPVLKIVKKYQEHPALYNREYIHLVFALLRDTEASVAPENPKIRQTFWMPFSEYYARLRAEPDRFTKTSRFYLLQPELLRATECWIAMVNAAVTSHASLPPVPPCRLQRAECYEYASGPLLLISRYQEAITCTATLFDGTEVREHLDDLIWVQVQDSRQTNTLQFRALDTQGRQFEWTGESLHTHVPQRPEMWQGERSLLAVQTVNQRNQRVAAAMLSDQRSALATLSDHCQSLEERLTTFCAWHTTGRTPFAEKATPGLPKRLFVNLGTFDPVHYGHIRLLLDALHQVLSTDEAACWAKGFLVPIGERAPGPNGQVWKQQKQAFAERFHLCHQSTTLFAPFLSTTDLGGRYPDAYGLELALRLVELNADGKPVDLYVAMGAETWNGWQASFAQILARLQRQGTLRLTPWTSVPFRLHVILQEWFDLFPAPCIEPSCFSSLTILPAIVNPVRSSVIRDRYNFFIPLSEAHMIGWEPREE